MFNRLLVRGHSASNLLPTFNLAIEKIFVKELIVNILLQVYMLRIRRYLSSFTYRLTLTTHLAAPYKLTLWILLSTLRQAFTYHYLILLNYTEELLILMNLLFVIIDSKTWAIFYHQENYEWVTISPLQISLPSTFKPCFPSVLFGYTPHRAFFQFKNYTVPSALSIYKL